MISILREINSKVFNSKTVVFEHGALFPRNDSGKSITHAHLHVFPCDFSFLDDAIANNYKYIEKSNVRDLEEVSKLYDKYLYLHDIDDKDYVIIHDGIKSQYFRQILAKKVGMSSGWNWRESPRIEDCLKILDDYEQNPIYLNILKKLKGDVSGEKH